MALFDDAFNDVAQLVRKFEEHRAEYLAPKYQEAELRADFLDQFWTALGWDVLHRFQTNPREQEVKIEKSDTAASGRRVDYVFRLKPHFNSPVFFCEAKKPSRDLNNVDDYFQLARYGYNASTPVDVLTNFEEFHILDCRYQPHIEKSFPSAQIEKYSYTDYLDKEKFGKIYWLFSREAVEAGKLKDFAKSLPKQRGSGKAKLTVEEAKPVDEAFLSKLEEYRLTLAKAFKKADDTLTAEVLTEATQKVIDRLVFIRFLEDKFIEADYIVDQIAQTPPPMSEAKRRGLGGGPADRSTQQQRTAWQKFLSWSKELDVKYNGVVFKPHDIDKPEWHAPDDKIFSELCADISHTRSKYLFTYIPIELLGSIYERFLGKVVTTTAKRAEIEDKPEVRKAGGVYYTPKYIVDYIVANTVGKILNGTPPPMSEAKRRGLGGGLGSEVENSSASTNTEPPPNPRLGKAGGQEVMEGLTPKEISKLRFADIACGSGSFLIAVYDTVLHHVEKWYNDHPEEARKAKCTEIEKGIYVLSLKQKQQILLDNIYGVDIDRQAVEVAQLSLFLKLLESESGATAEQLSFERTKILPDLSKNIQCGNSLVEYDISDLFPLTDEEEKRIKPFSFQSAFKPIMDAGGFNAIVGNPPYVRVGSLTDQFKAYAVKHFHTYTSGADLYTFFVERAHTLLRSDGYFGYICANKFMRASYGRGLRNYLATETLICELIDFGELPIFQGAATFPIIIITRKRKTSEQNFIFAAIKTLKFESLEKEVEAVRLSLTSKALQGDNWSLASETTTELIGKLHLNSIPLGSYLSRKINYGIKTALNEAFVIDSIKRQEILSLDPASSQFIKPFVNGDDVRKYQINYQGAFVIVIPNGWTRSQKPTQIDAWNWFSSNYPGLAGHLLPHKIKAEKRSDQGEFWWELRPCDYYSQLDEKKIVWPEIAKESRFAYDEAGLYLNKTCFFTPSSDKALLGILNSRLIWFFLKTICSVLGDAEKGGRLMQQKIYIDQIPIARTLNQNDSSLSKLVDQMLDAKKRLAQTMRDSEREQLERKCQWLDSEIDKLVYRLYGLTAEEIRIVEGSS